MKRILTGMMTGRIKKAFSNRRGVSLLEVLLVVMLMTALATGAATMFDDWFKKSVNRKVATEMRDVQEAAEQYVVLNMNDVVGQVPDEGDVAELDIATLINRDFLPPGFVARNSFNQSIRVLMRNAGDDTVKGTTIEVLAVGDDRNGIDSRMVDSRLFDAALSGGPKLGLISAADMGTYCCNGNIQSAYGEWVVPLSDFSAVYNRTPDVTQGGYMAAYGRVSMQDVNNENYLYRVDMPDDPHLNRMMTNMDLNNNDIVNAGVVVSDNMNVGGNAVLEGRAASGAVSPYVLAVQDNFTTDSTMTVTADGDNKGDLIVAGDTDGATADFTVTGNMALPADASSIVTSASTVNVLQNMDSGVFEVLTVNGSAFQSPQIIAVTTSIDGNVQTSFLQTAGAEVQDITAVNAVVGITDVSNATTLTGSVVTENAIAVEGATNAGALNATNILGIDNLIYCGTGCP